MFKISILLITYLSLSSCSYFQRKSFENTLDKNKLEQCISREKNKCNSKKTESVDYMTKKILKSASASLIYVRINRI